MKNWLPLERFSPGFRQAESAPRKCRNCGSSSGSSVVSKPPLPQVSGSPLIEFGSPPWISVSRTARWNLVPL
jgi:hypothetical protein